MYFAWLCAAWLPFCYMMHAWLLCSFETLTYRLYRLILLPILAFWLFLLYDYLIHLDMCILIVACLIHLDMLIIFVVYYLDHLWACYSYVYSSQLFCFLLSLCVDMNDIFIICMTVCYMTSFFLHDACIASLCGTHIYLLTPTHLSRSTLFPLILYFMRLVVLFVFQPS